jgi:hypothetical protein
VTREAIAKAALPLAIAAYSPCAPPAVSLGLRLDDRPNCLIKAVFEDKTAWGFARRNGKAVEIAIRGTETQAEWALDANAPQVHWWRGEGRVHAGFVQLYAAMYPSLTEAVGNLYGAEYVLISSHSLGAGVGTLYAVELAFSYPSLPVYLCTFGSPRVGDAAFVEFAHTLPNLTCVRVANTRDMVTMLPGKILYKHLGDAYLFNGGIHAPSIEHSLEKMYGTYVQTLTGSSAFEYHA